MGVGWVACVNPTPSGVSLGLLGFATQLQSHQFLLISVSFHYGDSLQVLNLRKHVLGVSHHTVNFRDRRRVQVLDPSQLAMLSEFAEEDRALAEANMSDYAALLEQEDRL